jgi:hypothetical protein
MARFLLPIISTGTTTPRAFPRAGLVAGGARLSRPPGAQVGLRRSTWAASGPMGCSPVKVLTS